MNWIKNPPNTTHDTIGSPRHRDMLERSFPLVFVMRPDVGWMIKTKWRRSNYSDSAAQNVELALAALETARAEPGRWRGPQQPPGDGTVVSGWAAL